MRDVPIRIWDWGISQVMLSGPVFFIYFPFFFPFSSSSILGIGIGETQTVVILRTTVGMVVVGDVRS